MERDIKLFDLRVYPIVDIIAFWDQWMPEGSCRIPQDAFACVDHKTRVSTVVGTGVFHREQR